MITIPEDKIPALVKHVYDMSQPVGMGILHFTPDSLTEDEIKSMIRPEERVAVRMDYVKGRQCKMTVFREEDGTFRINDYWYDHSDRQFEELLSKIGVSR